LPTLQGVKATKSGAKIKLLPEELNILLKFENQALAYFLTKIFFFIPMSKQLHDPLTLRQNQ